MYGVLFASISSASTYSMLFAPAVLLPSSCSLVCTVHSIVSFPPSLNEKMSFEHVFFYFVDESTTLHSGCTRSSTTRIFFRFCNGFFLLALRFRFAAGICILFAMWSYCFSLYLSRSYSIGLMHGSL